MYGQCEATARMGYLPADKALEKKGSMGVAIPGGAFCLIDENGAVVTAPFTTGELVYEGPNVTLGYAECAGDLAKGDERGGVLETGDMAQFDEDGYSRMYVFDNCRDFIRTVPTLQFQKGSAEDLDTEGEDHAADEWRYACMSRPVTPVRECAAATGADLLRDPLK